MAVVVHPEVIVNALLRTLVEVTTGPEVGVWVGGHNVIMVDCMASDNPNSVQFDHAFAAETACNYLTCQGRRQIALIHPQGSGFAEQVLLGYKHALEKNFLPFNRNLVFMDATSSSTRCWWPTSRKPSG
jgi:hypothetical protein